MINKVLSIAISSRALFDLEEGHQVFLNKGVEAYSNYQIEHENEILQPGIAFSMVKKLLALNNLTPNDAQNKPPKVEVILLSRNSTDTGLRIFNSIAHYKLDIVRAAFSRGASPLRYVKAFETDLFLSSDPDDVTQALQQGFAAATLLPSVKKSTQEQEQQQLRIAFDGDAVLFSDESERVFSQQGLRAFDEFEKKSADTPLSAGPFKEFLTMLHLLQSHFPEQNAPIRTALVTSRGAPAHERVIKTLRAWQIRIDEAIFLGGKDKGAFLEAFGADIFFDDQNKHCLSAANFVSTGHVPHGIANEKISIKENS